MRFNTVKRNDAKSIYIENIDTIDKINITINKMANINSFSFSSSKGIT
jgi:hypothetical protein